MLRWNTWHCSGSTRHSVSHFDTNKNDSLQNQYVKCINYDFPSQLEIVRLEYTKDWYESKQCLIHLLKSLKVHQHLFWVITWKLLSVYFHSLQKTLCSGSNFTINLFVISAESSQSPCQNYKFVVLLHKTVFRNELASYKIERASNLLISFHELYIYIDLQGILSKDWLIVQSCMNL